jgi:electron transport complex protein RnfG
MVGIDKDGNITGYQILQTAETPGLGTKADLWFQKDGKGCVIGMNAKDNPLFVKKDGGEVDAITAATITSRAFCDAINRAYKAIKYGGNK